MSISDEWPMMERPGQSNRIGPAIVGVLVACGSGGCHLVNCQESCVTVQSKNGTVRAPSEYEAKEVMALAECLAPHVAHELCAATDPPFVIDICKESLYPVQSLTLFSGKIGTSPPIEIRIGHDSMQYSKFLLAHEFVHWYANGEWNRLPAVLEEGIANLEGVACDHEAATEFFENVSQAFERTDTIRPELYAANLEQIANMPFADRMLVYGIGCVIVHNIGISELHRLCQERDGFLADDAWYDAMRQSRFVPETSREWLKAIEEDQRELGMQGRW